MLHEKLEEWGVPIWAAAIDYRKASDTVEHGEIWIALEEQGVPLQYVQIFKRLYVGQTRVVVAKREGRAVRITGGAQSRAIQ